MKLGPLTPAVNFFKKKVTQQKHTKIAMEQLKELYPRRYAQYEILKKQDGSVEVFQKLSKKSDKFLHSYGIKLDGTRTQTMPDYRADRDVFIKTEHAPDGRFNIKELVVHKKEDGSTETELLVNKTMTLKQRMAQIIDFKEVLARKNANK